MGVVACSVTGAGNRSVPEGEIRGLEVTIFHVDRQRGVYVVTNASDPLSGGLPGLAPQDLAGRERKAWHGRECLPCRDAVAHIDCADAEPDMPLERPPHRKFADCVCLT